MTTADTLLLLSGGMDSIALAWWLRPRLAVTIDYGQLPVAGEIEAARAVCTELCIEHVLVSLDAHDLGSGDMAGTAPSPLAPVSEWWPYRNQLLITVAAAVALKHGVSKLSFGAVATDGAHIDGQPRFFDLMRQLVELQEGSVSLETPAIGETTSMLCRRVAVPFEVLAWAHSCHVASVACGRCRGCFKHRDTMRDLGYGEY